MIRKRKFVDTGYFSWSNESLDVNSVAVVEFDLRFEPYNDLKIVNLSTSNDVEITINQHSVQVCPFGSEIQINQEVVKDIRVKNIGSTTISANEIRVFYRNDGYRGREYVSNAKSIGGALLWLTR